MEWQTGMAEIREQLEELSLNLPELSNSFSDLKHAVNANGPLDQRSKELIGVGIAVAKRCEPSIGLRVEALAKAGGSRDELGDALAVAVMMGGGPSLIYAAKALAAWDALIKL